MIRRRFKMVEIGTIDLVRCLPYRDEKGSKGRADAGVDSQA